MPCIRIQTGCSTFTHLPTSYPTLPTQGARGSPFLHSQQACKLGYTERKELAQGHLLSFTAELEFEPGGRGKPNTLITTPRWLPFTFEFCREAVKAQSISSPQPHIYGQKSSSRWSSTLPDLEAHDRKSGACRRQEVAWHVTGSHITGSHMACDRKSHGTVGKGTRPGERTRRRKPSAPMWATARGSLRARAKEEASPQQSGLTWLFCCPFQCAEAEGVAALPSMQEGLPNRSKGRGRSLKTCSLGGAPQTHFEHLIHGLKTTAEENHHLQSRIIREGWEVEEGGEREKSQGAPYSPPSQHG